MADGIFSSMAGSFGAITTILKYAAYFFIGLIVAGIITLIVLFIVIKLKSTKIIEVNMTNRKVQIMTGRFRRNRQGIKMLWVGKLKKFIPKVQQDDVFLFNKTECIILVKDNNAMHHTARVPNYDEILEWYKAVYDVNLEKDIKSSEFRKIQKDIATVYLTPNPSEDLDWLANQVMDANKEFAQAWWQSPTVAILGTVFICAFVFIITLIITKKM